MGGYQHEGRRQPQITFYVESDFPGTQERFEKLRRFICNQPAAEKVAHLRPGAREILGEDFTVVLSLSGLKVYEYVPNGKLVALIHLAPQE